MEVGGLAPAGRTWHRRCSRARAGWFGGSSGGNEHVFSFDNVDYCRDDRDRACRTFRIPQWSNSDDGASSGSGTPHGSECRAVAAQRGELLGADDLCRSGPV
jgi:hypothetical protein